MYSLFDECLTETEVRLFETPSLCYAHETHVYICMCMCVCVRTIHACRDLREILLGSSSRLVGSTYAIVKKNDSLLGPHRKPPNFLSKGASSPRLPLGRHLTCLGVHLRKTQKLNYQCT